MAIGSPQSCNAGHHSNWIFNIDAQDAQDFFRKGKAFDPGHPQTRSRLSPEPTPGAASSRPVNPVH